MTMDSLETLIARLSENAILDEQTAAEDLAAAQKALRLKRLEPYRSQLPDADVRRIVDQRLDSKAWRVVARWLAAHEARGWRYLWLSGPTGTGKTVALAGALAERDGVVVLGYELVRAYRYESREALDLRAKIERSRTLILDDVGTHEREHEAAAMFAAINSRQGGGKITLISGNLTENQIREYDSRIVSRILGAGAIVEIAGEDMRRAKR